ncbi:MAG: hypothetical protein DI537_53370 [Stutzerimonas stutzeri]|nr:MAG: hypothetical protein DI537_53370 [Stutzerimonas stutzeri]
MNSEICAARCQEPDLAITLPTKKTISHNAAESCALSLMWHHATVEPRYQPAFMKMLQNRHKREIASKAASGDLFGAAA